MSDVWRGRVITSQLYMYLASTSLKLHFAKQTIEKQSTDLHTIILILFVTTRVYFQDADMQLHEQYGLREPWSFEYTWFRR